MRKRALALGVTAVTAVAGVVLLDGCKPPPPPAKPPAPLAVVIPPLCDTQVGEELRLRRGSDEWVWRVLSTTDMDVEVEFRRVAGAETATSETQRWSRNGWGINPNYLVREIRRDRIQVAGRDWDCWLIRVVSRNDSWWYWISEELPAFGFVRVAIDEGGAPKLGFAMDVVPEASSFPK